MVSSIHRITLFLAVITQAVQLIHASYPFELTLNGITIHRVADGNQTGYTMSNAGDINNDKIEDFIICTSGSLSNNKIYVVFGNTSENSSSALELSTLSGANGFIIVEPTAANEQVEYSVKAAGDINGDKIDDLIIRTYFRSSDKNKPTTAGAVYAIFGKAVDDIFDSPLLLFSLNSADGMILKEVTYRRSSFKKAGGTDSEALYEFMEMRIDKMTGENIDDFFTALVVFVFGILVIIAKKEANSETLNEQTEAQVEPETRSSAGSNNSFSTQSEEIHVKVVEGQASN